MAEGKPDRIIWVFALGYFAFYGPYSALIKLVTGGRLADVPAGLSGFELLPATLAGTIAGWLLFLSLFGWWKYAVRPSPALIVSGIGTAVLIAATTIAYTFQGISIVFALLLMRGGVLIMAPVVDGLLGRNVRWFSWVALALSVGALGVALLDVEHYQMSWAAGANLAAYFSGYLLRIPCMTKVAKIADRDATRRYFVTEMLVALAGLATFALLAGITTFQPTPTVAPALLIGVLYSALYVFGTLIYLDRRENTFCIPLNRAASLLAGIVAAYGLATTFGTPFPSLLQLVAVGMIVAALMMLSPAHHLFELARATREAVPPL